ncbi:unnamed protein product [Darwinula stevensoni]|uniref:Uncharacterized protein n=1 Tax=Darwinula stevensoni TaxID=69355 RepID=A0A7R9AEM9_9CRUS|nr:unnamed protein product [Darwinula stevensoni]CAG0902243.1 unnamed protein product [Darwinula stevensoni]
MVDPLVDVFLSRDLDSRVSWREAFAVKEWLSTPATYHIMRDHPKHDIPMLAGTFGMKLGERASMEVLYGELPKRFSGARNNKLLDQVYLTAVIWPLAVS